MNPRFLRIFVGMFHTLVIGASEKPDRYSYIATQMLTQAGYSVYALGFRSGTIGNTPIHTTWPAPGSVDTITVYVNPQRLQAMMEHILQLKARRIIFNPGTEDEQLEKRCSEAGMHVMEACTLVLIRSNQYDKA